ncbi:hypothetical protein GCM10009670_25760 [Citricoccus alkalitolerans]
MAPATTLRLSPVLATWRSASEVRDMVFSLDRVDSAQKLGNQAKSVSGVTTIDIFREVPHLNRNLEWLC